MKNKSESFKPTNLKISNNNANTVIDLNRKPNYFTSDISESMFFLIRSAIYLDRVNAFRLATKNIERLKRISKQKNCFLKREVKSLFCKLCHCPILRHASFKVKNKKQITCTVCGTKKLIKKHLPRK